MFTIMLTLINIIVVIVMVVTFIKAFSTFRHVGKIDNYESEIDEEMTTKNKKGTKYMLISITLVPVSIILTIIIILSSIMIN